MREGQSTTATAKRHAVGEHERRRRAEALRRHHEDRQARGMGALGELSYLRAQMRLAARLTARLGATNDVEVMVELVVEELHGTFAFYLAAVQRVDPDGVLRLIAGRGALAEVMAEFLLVEQSLHQGINGRVARSGVSALVADTREDDDYIVRDPHTDPRSELSVPIIVDDAEWVTMKSHSIVGGELVARIDAFAHLAPAVRASHERWDGGGYPDGLAGEGIPLAARIIAACDTYEAMVTDRPYRSARTPEQARRELRRVSGTQLDADVVRALLQELGLNGRRCSARQPRAAPRPARGAATL